MAYPFKYTIFTGLLNLYGLNPDTHIIVASVHRQAFSETFIRHHVAHLPYNVGYAWGGYLGHSLDNDTLMRPLLARIPFVGEKLLQEKWVNLITQRNIKLVLAEYGPVGVHWLPVCKKAGVPLLVYFHGFDVTHKNILTQYQLKYKELFKYASSIFVVSEPMRKRLLEWGAPEHKLVLNPCGADLSIFMQNQGPKNGQTVMAVGRFSQTKRPDLTIKAFFQVLKQVPDAKLKMAGEGEILKDCKRLAKELGVESQVEFLGILTPQSVATEMHNARLFVQHSMTTPDGETEGSPVAIMEAGASGLPVVSTRHAGIPEIVEHGKTGFLVEEGDVEGMAKYIIHLLQNPILAEEMGVAAHQRIAEHFSLERNIRILTETIEKHL